MMCEQLTLQTESDKHPAAPLTDVAAASGTASTASTSASVNDENSSDSKHDVPWASKLHHHALSGVQLLARSVLGQLRDMGLELPDDSHPDVSGAPLVQSGSLLGAHIRALERQENDGICVEEVHTGHAEGGRDEQEEVPWPAGGVQRLQRVAGG